MTSKLSSAKPGGSIFAWHLEQLASLRAIPGLITLRPCDANEVAEAWRVIMQMRHEPVCLILTRQPLPTLDRTRYAPAAGLAKGAYVLADCDGTPQVLLIGTGSEVSLCVGAYEQLTAAGVAVRVVSMPCWELFDAQAQAYRDSVLPPAVTARVAVEAAVELGWEKYLGPRGRFVGMTSFGASAPGGALMKHFGFTVEAVVRHANELLAKG